MIELNIKDKNGDLFCHGQGQKHAYLTRHHGYQLGDYFEVNVDKAPAFVWINLDESLSPSIIYMTKKTWRYKVPFNLYRESPYAEGAFAHRNGYSEARIIDPNNMGFYYNLAKNSYDQHEESDAYPHASANVETRGEQVFLAKNAIDGVLANESHGNYPFQSWGIGGRADAAITIEFGRTVQVDQIGLVLRADYPHDSYWKSASLAFSDHSTISVSLQRTAQEQLFKFKPKKIKWVRLSNLIPAKEKGFRSLTQIEVYGRNL